MSVLVKCFLLLAAKRPRRLRTRTSKRAGLVMDEALEQRTLLAASTFTPEEQFMLELMNRARANPTAEANRLGIGLNDSVPADRLISTATKQPLAPNNLLRTAAVGHTDDMFNRDFFAHTSPNPNSMTFGQRATAAGYIWSNVSENLSLQGGTAINQAIIQDMHDGLFRSSGHRVNMMNNVYFETGVGTDAGKWADNGNILNGGAGTVYDVGLGTIKFGTQADKPYLTGVVYSDATSGSQNNSFFDVGEQAGNGATVTATDTSTGTSYTERVGPGGGYSIQVPSGTYNVSISGGGLAATYYDLDVVVGTINEKVDFETTTASTTPPAGSGGDGDVDGSSSFDANDSFLIQLILLAGSNSQIEQSKGTSRLSAAEIRSAVTSMLTGDVDGSGDFDANDGFLIHLVKLSGSNTQIDQSKGASPLSATAIRSRVDALGLGGSTTSNTAPGTAGKEALFDTASESQSTEQTSLDSVAEDSTDELWADFRTWLDVLQS